MSLFLFFIYIYYFYLASGQADKLSSNFCDAIDSHTFLTFLFAYQNGSTGNAAIDTQAAAIWTHLASSVPSLASEKFSFPEQSAKGIQYNTTCNNLWGIYIYIYYKCCSLMIVYTRKQAKLH